MGVDSRQEPLPAGTPPETITNYRVDRVFGPTPRVPRAEDATEAASAVLEQRRGNPQTVPPFATEATSPESELSLRRQLSRLQRQLAEAQRELANKEDELAAEVEKRIESLASNESVVEQQRALHARVEQYAADELRTAGIEQRLQEANATADELGQFLERERAARIIAQARVDELTLSFDETRQLWNAERQMSEERVAAENAQLEAKRKAALEASEQALTSATGRLKDAHEAELAEQKQAHERSMSALRGELEPRALEAHTLAEERERLKNEITALKNDAIREAAARDENQAREKAQAAAAYGVEQAAAARVHAAELAKATGDRDAQILSLQQSLRSSEALTRGLEEGTAALREGQLKVQRELAEAKERGSQLDAQYVALTERLVGALATVDTLTEENRGLREQLDASAAEARRNALDRMRFVAYLEEGLALLGALPPAPEPPTIETIESPDE